MSFKVFPLSLVSVPPSTAQRPTCHPTHVKPRARRQVTKRAVDTVRVTRSTGTSFYTVASIQPPTMAMYTHISAMLVRSRSCHTDGIVVNNQNQTWQRLKPI